jgi:antitoxin component YwqK of YwqJK toxin-antitoxin module
MEDIIGYKIGFTNNRKVLIKLSIPNDALTNKDRDTIIDPKYAKYRCNRAYVVYIIDMYENEYDKAISFYSKNKLLYEKNKIVLSNFDKDIIQENSNGIHYFTDKELALNYNIPILYQEWKDENDIYKDYYGNGQLHKKIKYYLDDNKKIIYKNVQEYYINGQIKKDYNLDINKYDGLYREWYKDGIMKTRLTYDKNKVISFIENWDVRGIKH